MNEGIEEAPSQNYLTAPRAMLLPKPGHGHCCRHAILLLCLSQQLDSNRRRFNALFNFGTKKAPPPKKKEVTVKPEVDRLVWFLGAQPLEWLDGTMIGDRGFDPFGFGKPAEYLQFELDSLDQNLAKNVASDVIGTRVETTEVKPTPFQPYTEVFGLQRFCECELIHGRWPMLGTFGALAVEGLTGVAWQDAGKEELEILKWNQVGSTFLDLMRNVLRV